MKQICVILLILGVFTATSGCGSSGTEQSSRRSSSPVAAQEETSQTDTAPREVDATGSDGEESQELSAEDRAAAKKQRICPVTGGLLGSMGEPYKLQVKNRTVFLCCEGCAGAILQDPDKYLKKLEQAPVQK